MLTREATLKWSIHYLQITQCSCVCMCVFVGAHAPITCWSQSVVAAGEQWDGVSAIINSEIKCSHLRSQVRVCFLFFSCYNEAAIQNTICRRLCWSIYYNITGALFSLCFMACSCCSSILVFLSLVKCCHSPVFGCGPEGP